jgi:hypothetical protein
MSDPPLKWDEIEILLEYKRAQAAYDLITELIVGDNTGEPLGILGAEGAMGKLALMQSDEHIPMEEPVGGWPQLPPNNMRHITRDRKKIKAARKVAAKNRRKK